MLGGNVRSSLCCVDGIYTTSFIREFHVDKVFFGANGFDVTEGITITNISASLVKRAMIEMPFRSFCWLIQANTTVLPSVVSVPSAGSIFW